MNIGVRVPFRTSAFVFLRQPRSRITGSCGTSIFNFLRNPHGVCHSVCPNLHSHQQCTCVPFSPRACQHLLLLVFVCIFLMISGVEHLFMCLLAISMSSLEKCLLRPLAHFQLSFFCFAVVLYGCILYILWIFNLFQIYDLQIFPPIQHYAFSFCWFPLLCRNFF